VQCEESIPVSIDGEVRHDPNDLAEKVDDRTDIVEGRAQALGPQVVDAQAGGFRGFPGDLRIARRAGRSSSTTTT
jgi:hypothetical protein